MQRLLTLSVVSLLAVFITTGCGKPNNLIRAKGQVVKNGENYRPDEDENLQVCFSPVADDFSPPRNWYAAEVDPATGAFYAAGGEKKGMPPGKYRVMIELKKNRKDLLGGKFDSLNSPYIFDVDPTSEEMIVDIGAPAQKAE